MSPRIYRHLILSLCLGLVLISTACSSRGSRSGGVEPDLKVTDEDLALEQNRWKDGSIPVAAEGGAFADILFDYDSSSVRSQDQERLRQDAHVLQGDQTLRVQVEGHCDKRGTAEYNLALGEDRAKAVAALLLSFGARPEQVSTISYGEEIPLDTRDTDEAFAKNRRVHFGLLRAQPEARKY